MKHAAITALLCIALAPAAWAGEAETFDEPVSGLSFPTVRTVSGRPYVLLGAGVVKKKDGTGKPYAVALFVDEKGARRAFPALAQKSGGRTRDKLRNAEKTAAFVVWGDFGKVGVVRFLDDTVAADVRAAFEEGLAPLLVASMPAELRDRARALIDLFTEDVKKGEEVVVHTGPGGQISIELGGAKKEAATDPRLARGLWEAWLGGRPISNDVRKALVDRIEVLGK